MKKSLIYVMCLLIAVLMSVNNTSGQIPSGFYGKNIIQSGGEATTLYSAEKNPSGIEVANKLVQTKNGYAPWDENAVKKHADENDDGICGIYEGKYGLRLGCVKRDGEYVIIYLNKNGGGWRTGDTKATLRPSATTGLFKATWIETNSENKKIERAADVIFDGGNMRVSIPYWGSESFYLKMYPTTTSYSSSYPAQTEKWSGSGFALNNGYLCTNYHVVNEAKSVRIFGVQGDFTTSYSAKVVASDKVNDLAILKVDDANFSGFGTIPYNVKTTMDEVGEDIFVLGYPLTTTMGDEIKLTTGVISARTGFQGDVSMYQISAPIQPGNSGGPLFDSRGDLVGIVSARHIGAENVGYAVKTSYLRNLMNSSLSEDILPKNDAISSQPLTGKVSKVKNFVFYIVCSSQEGQIATIPSNTTKSQNKPKNNSDKYVEYEIPEGTPIYIDVKGPQIDLSKDKSVTVKRVRVTDSQTIVDMECRMDWNWGVGINPETIIKYNGGTCSLIDAVNIPKTPEYYYSCESENLSFTLVFQGIPKATSQFDLIEPHGWKFYGIVLNPVENQNEISNVNLDVTNPYFSISTSPMGMTINRVRVTDMRTYVDIECDNLFHYIKDILVKTEESKIVTHIDKSSSSQAWYPLINAKGIPINSEGNYYANINQKFQFTLIFPAIPEDSHPAKLYINESLYFYRIDWTKKVNVRTATNPHVKKCPRGLTVKRVIATNQRTIVYIEFDDKDDQPSRRHIKPVMLRCDGKKYNESYTIGANRYKDSGGRRLWEFDFPAISTSATKFDITSRKWKICGISLE